MPEVVPAQPDVAPDLPAEQQPGPPAEPMQGVGPGLPTVPAAAVPGPAQHDTMLELQNQIRKLNSELNKKDQAIAMGNSQNIALEAARAQACQTNLELETEAIKMNAIIEQSTPRVKLLQEENSELATKIQIEESQQRTERARNLENLESVLGRLTKKMRLESGMTAPAPMMAPVQLLAAPLQHSQMSALPGRATGVLPAYQTGALPGLATGILPAHQTGALPGLASGTLEHVRQY